MYDRNLVHENIPLVVHWVSPDQTDQEVNPKPRAWQNSRFDSVFPLLPRVVCWVYLDWIQEVGQKPRVWLNPSLDSVFPHFPRAVRWIIKFKRLVKSQEHDLLVEPRLGLSPSTLEKYCGSTKRRISLLTRISPLRSYQVSPLSLALCWRGVLWVLSLSALAQYVGSFLIDFRRSV